MAFFPISGDEFAGIVTVDIVAILSTLALFSIVVRVAWLGVLRLYKRNITQTKEYVFFHTQLGYYAACLLIANMFSSSAGLMGLPFLVDRGITEGTLCTAQAIFMQFANIAAAYFTVSIAVHTFTSLVLRRRQSRLVYMTTISLGWICAGFIAALPLFIPHSSGPIYGQYALTCGVTDEYPTHQFMLHLLPIFIAAFVSAVLYSIIFLVLRGTLVMKGGVKITLNPEERWNGQSGENYHRFIASIARSMLWYPVAYVCLLVPYSVTKLLYLSGFDVLFEGLIFAYTCWFLLGVANVCVLYNTFRKLYPAFDTKISTTQPDIESFGTAGETDVDSATLNSRNTDMIGRKITDYRSSPDSMDSSEKNVALPSFYSYPVSPRQELVASPPPPSFNNYVVADHYRAGSVNSIATSSYASHSRQDSSESLTSLPVPPRTNRSRSPRVPARTSPSPLLVQALSNETSPLPTRRLLTPSPSGHHISTTSEQLDDISQWVSRQTIPVQAQALGSAQSQMVENRPMLSAVKPAFTYPAVTSPSPALTNSRPRASQNRTMSPPASASSHSGTSVDYYATRPAAVPLMGPPPLRKAPVRRQGSF